MRMIQQQSRCFSAEEGGKANIPEPTQEEVAAHKDEWGIKYNDECFKFEKEWELIAGQVEKEQNVFIESELGDLQKEKVKMLVDKTLTLNLFEMRYFQILLKTQVQKATGMNPLKLNLDWPSIKQDASGTWPPANPNWFK